MIVPKEDQEAYVLAKRLRANNYKFSHIGNESGQRGTKNIIIMMAKKKRMGVSPGFPDYCIILKNGSLLFIELKRQKPLLKSGKFGKSPSKVTDEQIERVDQLSNLQNIKAKIAYGAIDGINFIKNLESGIPN